MGLKIKGQQINEMSHADNKVVIAKTEAQMQMMINRMNSPGLKYGMKIKAGKTKVMQFTKDDNKEVQIKIGM